MRNRFTNLFWRQNFLMTTDFKTMIYETANIGLAQRKLGFERFSLMYRN